MVVGDPHHQRPLARPAARLRHAHASMPAQEQRGVGAAEAEAVGHHRVEPGVVHPLRRDLAGPELGIERLDVDRGRDEVVAQHQQAVDRLLRAGRALAVAGHRLGRADRRRRPFAEHPPHRLDLAHVADRGRGAVRVDVADLPPLGQRRRAPAASPARRPRPTAPPCRARPRSRRSPSPRRRSSRRAPSRAPAPPAPPCRRRPR